MISLGAFSLSYVVIALTTLVTAITGAALGWRTQVGGRVADRVMQMLLVGLVLARIVFVLSWFELYRLAPWSMLDIRDGGFSFWPGAVAAVLFGLACAWRETRIRRPLLIGMGAGVLCWIMLARLMWVMQQSMAGVPEVELATLDGTPIRLQALAGKPMVVNLWATWCPPCRREMPTLQHAQKTIPQVTFVFANQGEDAATISAYLDSQDLQLDHVLVDAFSAISQEVGSRGLPTTLFFDRDGRLVDSHVGELSPATLAQRLQRFDVPGAGKRAP